MAEPAPPGGSEAVNAVRRLRLEAATANAFDAFDAAGVQGFLLKGAALSAWLYPEGPKRTFSDSDILVRPADWAAAQDVLRSISFAPHLDEGAMPAWWEDHAIGWFRGSDGALIDLHRSLPGVGVDPEALWNRLSAEADQVAVGGRLVPTLTVPDRAMHLALHTAQHGGFRLHEVQRAVEVTDDDTWRAAAAIAQELDATPAFATGLRMVPEGAALAQRLGLPETAPVDVQLRAAHAPPVALGFDQLSRAPGVRARLSILGHKVFPPPTFMRTWSTLARRSRLGLALAYLWRPIWLVIHAPAGFRAWSNARRKTRG